MSEFVRVTIVRDDVEADIVRGLLESAGIPSVKRVTDVAAGGWDGLPVGGAREILVPGDRLEEARELLEPDGGASF
jgi:Putative prokaryotic signal transducing protein